MGFKNPLLLGLLGVAEHPPAPLLPPLLASTQEIKLKVGMHCQKCRTEVMKAVTKLTGVDQLSVDLEKEMLVVIGDVDPVCVATCLRKKKKAADIVSVGPLKSKETGVAKKDVLEPNQTATVRYSCAPYDSGYQQIVYGYPPCYEYWRL